MPTLYCWEEKACWGSIPPGQVVRIARLMSGYQRHWESLAPSYWLGSIWKLAQHWAAIEPSRGASTLGRGEVPDMPCSGSRPNVGWHCRHIGRCKIMVLWRERSEVYTLPAGHKLKTNAVIHSALSGQATSSVVQVLPCGVAVCYVVVCWLVDCGMPAGRPV